MRQTLRPGNRSDAQSHQDDLCKTRPGICSTVQTGDQARYGNVEEAGRRQGQRIRQRTERTLQAKIRCDPAEDGR